MDELRELYQAEAAGVASRLPELPVTYEDYVRWQRRILQASHGERLWSYWRGELSGELPVLDLPTDYSRPPAQSFRGGTVSQRLDAGLTSRLKELARRECVTLYTVLLAAYQVLLHRYTGQDDIVVGTPAAGRPRDELAGLVGDFVNMLPLRLQLAGGPSFRQVLTQVRGKVVAAIEHQDFPFSLMVDRLQLTRDLSRSPIFQTTFVLQMFHRYKELSRVMLPSEDEPAVPFGNLALEPLPLAQQDGQFDLNLEMKEDDEGRLVGAWKYAADLFDASMITRMSQHFATLLGEIAADPERPVAKLPLLTGAERRAAIARGCGPAIELPPESSVCELFERQAQRRGAAIAVRDARESLTYSELRERVARLAEQLVALGVRRGGLVAVLHPRGVDFVTALLAISKAGAAFLPLDPRHPLSRIAQILETSGALLVLTTAQLAEDARQAVAALAESNRPRVMDFGELSRAAASASLPAIHGDDLAYVMFTSGSTGSPKGAMVEHRGMVNHVLAKLSDLEMDEHSVLAQNGPQSFDIVVWQCLAPLVVGGRVEVFEDDVAEDPARLLKEVQRRGVTVLQLVPTMLHAVLEEAAAAAGGAPQLTTLRWLVPTGDALPTALCRRWLQLYPGIPVLNTYGSTECSDDQCHYAIRKLAPADDAAPVISIGTPIPNMTAYVLDANLAPVPVGVVGELYIGGLGVGRGYCNEPQRTDAAFLPDPFSSQPGAAVSDSRSGPQQGQRQPGLPRTRRPHDQVARFSHRARRD